MILTIDPTSQNGFALRISQKSYQFTNAAALIRQLAKLKITPAVTLQIIRGPGSFNKIRSLALIVNTIALITGCQLKTRHLKQKKFQLTPAIQPFYGKPLKL